MNRKMFEAMMHAEPENPDRRYVFIVDNENLAMFIFLAGFSAVLLQQEQDEYYFDAEGLVDYLRSLELRGTNRMDYLYVPACSTKKQNDLLTEYFKEQYLEYREGWRLFKDKDYLTRLDADQEVKKIVRQFVDRYEKKPDEEPDLDRYHMLDKDGKPTSPMDIAIVEQIMESVAFFSWVRRRICMRTESIQKITAGPSSRKRSENCFTGDLCAAIPSIGSTRC